MNFRKLLILPLLAVAVVGIATNMDMRRKPKKNKRKKNIRTEQVSTAQKRPVTTTKKQKLFLIQLMPIRLRNATILGLIV